MAADPSFEALMARLQLGDNEPAALVFRRYTDRLIALSKSRLPLPDEAEDVMQSVYRSFFTRQRAGEFDLPDWEHLWRLLVVITIRKCDNKIRHGYANRRDRRREVPLPASDSQVSVWEVCAREPTASQAAMLTETVEELIRSLDGQEERKILALSLRGFAAKEISEKLGCTERKVYRIRARVKKRLEERGSESEK